MYQVERDLGAFSGQPGRRPEGPYADLLPWLAHQAQEWAASAGTPDAPEAVRCSSGHCLEKSI